MLVTPFVPLCCPLAHQQRTLMLLLQQIPDSWADSFIRRAFDFFISAVNTSILPLVCCWRTPVLLFLCTAQEMLTKHLVCRLICGEMHTGGLLFRVHFYRPSGPAFGFGHGACLWNPNSQWH